MLTWQPGKLHLGESKKTLGIAWHSHYFFFSFPGLLTFHCCIFCIVVSYRPHHQYLQPSQHFSSFSCLQQQNRWQPLINLTCQPKEEYIIQYISMDPISFSNCLNLKKIQFSHLKASKQGTAFFRYGSNQEVAGMVVGSASTLQNSFLMLIHLEGSLTKLQSFYHSLRCSVVVAKGVI